MCPQRGQHDAIASAKPGRRPRAEKYCRARRLSRDRSGSCNRCSKNHAQFPNCFAHDTDHSSSGMSSNYALDNECDPTFSRKSVQGVHPYPISFLYHYTYPFRESILRAFTIVRAHAPLPSIQDDHNTDSQLSEGDITGLFGIFSDPFMEITVEPYGSRPTVLPSSQMPALQSRADKLLSRLFDHHQKSRAGVDFPVDSARIVFTAKNFEECVWAYFTVFHPQHPFIHWPTFDVHKVSSPLLLSVVCAGSVHCIPRDAALSTRSFFDLGEDFIFEQLRDAIAKNDRQDGRAMQIAQAAFLIQALQVSFNDEAVRRRIRISRHPELVASMRTLELNGPSHKSSLGVSEWRIFIAEESRVR